MGNIIRIVQCRSVLTKSKLPEVDYCVNPYVGCMHRCAYCYARFMMRFTNHAGDEWGHFLDVKENAASILDREMERKRVRGMILLGSVTDAYQPAEKKYGITRACLEVLSGYDVSTSILTKSNLVARDIDLLSKLSRCEVGMTVEFSEDRLSAIFDPLAAPISERIETLDRLKKHGIKTYAFVGPILPGLTDLARIVELVVGRVDYLMAESLNMRCGNKQALLTIIGKRFPDLLGAYERGFPDDYWGAVKRGVTALCASHNIPLKGFYGH